MPNERLSGTVDAVEQVDIGLSFHLRKGPLHRFPDDRLRGTADQARIFRVDPLKGMLRPAKYRDGRWSLRKQLAPASTIVFDLLRGQVLLGDIAGGTGHRSDPAFGIQHGYKNVVVIASFAVRGGEGRLVAHQLPGINYPLNLLLQAGCEFRRIFKLSEILPQSFSERFSPQREQGPIY